MRAGDPDRAFVAAVLARMAAELEGINRNSAIRFYIKHQKVITAHVEQEAPPLAGHVGFDESYFGGDRKGKRGRGASGKVPVFGLLQRSGKFHSLMIPHAKPITLMGNIREYVQPESIVLMDGYYSESCRDVPKCHHVRIDHRKISLFRAVVTSMTLRTSGTRPSDISGATLGSGGIPSTSKSASGATTADLLANSSDASEYGQNRNEHRLAMSKFGEYA
jgi:transposase-like protein